MDAAAPAWDVRPAAARAAAGAARGRRAAALARAAAAARALSATAGGGEAEVASSGAARAPPALSPSLPAALQVACAAEAYVCCVAAVAEARARLDAALAAARGGAAPGEVATALKQLRTACAPLEGRAWATQVSPLADGRLGSAEQEARQALGEAAARAVEASGVAWPPPLEPLEGEPSGGGAAALLEGGGKELKAALKAALRAQGGAGGKAVAHERELWALDALVVVPLRQALREAFAPAGGGAAAAAAAAALGRPELLFALARQFETEQGAAFAEALASLAPKGEAELSVASARGAVRCAVARAAAWHLREHTVGALAAAAAENGGGAAAAAADAWRRTLREALVLEKQLSVPPGAASISFASPVALEPLALAEAGAVLANAGGAARLEPSALKDSLGALIADFERAPEEVTFGVIRLAGAEVARQHLFELDMRLKEQEAMGLATTAELEAGGSVACDAFAVHRAFEDLGTALGLDPADETLPEEGMSPAEACAASLQATSRRYSALSEVAAAAVGAALARGAFGRLRRPAAAGVWLASQLRALRERCSAIAPEAFAAVWRCAAVDCAALLRGGRPRKDADARREALLDAFHEVTRRPERYMRCD